MKIAFSILTYRPMLTSLKKINIAILYKDIKNKIVYFETITNWDIIEIFDNEIDVDLFKMIIMGIKSHAERNLKNCSLEDYIKRYNNELKFEEVLYREADSLKELTLKIKQLYLEI
ncbi:TPA: hypothetical protein KOR49_002223 [Clostridioides difficile]|uniref:Uncharacterized protein n=1 Tax=Clostridioides difficile TaxID=1496 RepID=A0AAN5VPW7_CLODI|nr:hypothetical protein [Clostridioides difficile]EGT3944777.1 hypothetical protein [Clostridioides difficile]MBG0197894.1 hypothetical protein [Clostridioides difficile]MCA0574419.1 hypothetical protein [Clostridioides difficile]MDW0077013.1 hypothetical protein [Clostridioides difficile]PBG23761.1 hypothetical protein BGU81_18755 [Clostridioides difficile]